MHWRTLCAITAAAVGDYSLSPPPLRNELHTRSCKRRFQPVTPPLCCLSAHYSFLHRVLFIIPDIRMFCKRNRAFFSFYCHAPAVFLHSVKLFFIKNRRAAFIAVSHLLIKSARSDGRRYFYAFGAQKILVPLQRFHNFSADSHALVFRQNKDLKSELSFSLSQ